MDTKRFNRSFNKIVDNVNSVIYGKDDVVRLSMVAICAGGHILFEDVPGVGKSVMARALGQSMRATMNRVQCTPDMLPGDITGSSVIDTSTMKFTFRPGPVFTHVLLVDEVNRATPKTQSAMLEAMAEKTVSVDGVTHPLPQPFIVLATQNPVELAGTFPLPEAQLDRFLFKLTMGYPDHQAEIAVMMGNSVRLEVDDLEPVIDTSEVLDMMALSSEVKVSTAVQNYIVDITQATREDRSLTLGAGPRASINLVKASRVLAASDGRDRVYPEDVKAILRPVLGHRIMLTPDATLRGETIDEVLDRVLARVKAPMGVDDDPQSWEGAAPTRSAEPDETDEDLVEAAAAPSRSPASTRARRATKQRAATR